MFLAFLASLALAQTPQAPPTSGAQAQPAGPEAPLNLVEEIRPAIRWLRSTQDPLDGSYEKHVDATALVLRAFAECPDRYRAHDGPFVRRAAEWLVSKQREDGLIHDDGAVVAVRLAHTRLAADALASLGDASFGAPLAKALAALEENAGLIEALKLAPAAPELKREELHATARSILARRKERDRWDGPLGAIKETALAVSQLSRIDAEWKKNPVAGAPAQKVEPLPAFGAADRAAAVAAIERGADFLAATSQAGQWGAPGKPDAGMTAMALAALQCRPAPRPAAQQKVIDDGLAWLASLQKPDGSIHDGKLANYITSASVLAFVRSGDPKWKDALAAARDYLVGLQADEGEGYSEGDLYYGGIGYGSTERPDLSNLQMALEALSSSGLDPSAPTYRKALKFLERCQNRSESNDLRVADGTTTLVSGDDGGAAYAPGDSKAGFLELSDGRKVPRSYGSMTYALLKCLVFAGLSKDDPRFVAALDWCRKNYTLDLNPGFATTGDPSAPYQGLFYYLHSMARALDLAGVEELVDGAGKAHAWRNELCGRLVSMQSKIDGSWINHASPRWYEGNPLLATAYALLALDAALPRTEAR